MEVIVMSYRKKAREEEEGGKGVIDQMVKL